jgi:cysteinyl-tRNA synthetase
VDVARDAGLRSVGVEVQDLPQGRSHFRLVDKPSLSGAVKQAGGGDGDGAGGAWAGVDKAAIEPSELFKVGPYAGQFQRFDEKGLPTHDAEGKELSKSLRKKLEKKRARQVELFEAYKKKTRGA